MKKYTVVLLVVCVGLLVASVFAYQDPVYPFKVKIGGREAVKKSSTATFAVIEEPVASDAEIEVAAKGQVIVNAFPSDDKGNPTPGAAPAVLMFQAPKGSLAKTMDGKKLAAKKYLANIVASGATSRVMFTVK